MNSLYIKCKKVFIIFLLLIILFSYFSPIFAITNISNMKVGSKFRYVGTGLMIYNSTLGALLQSTSSVVGILRNHDNFIVEAKSRKYY